jgi:diguanylate cyclase
VGDERRKDVVAVPVPWPGALTAGLGSIAGSPAAHQSLPVAGGLFAGWLIRGALLRRQILAAGRDPVTGLPTRAAWTVRARRITRHGGMVALIDMDRFKDINDRFGHAAGDHLLTVTATRIRAWLGQAGGGVCGRLGGDEFVFATSATASAPQLDQLTAALRAPVRLPGGACVTPGASIGIACCQPGHEGLPTALAAADAAMYTAKHAGGAGWRTADGDLGPQSSRKRPAGRPRAGRSHRPAAATPPGDVFAQPARSRR